MRYIELTLQTTEQCADIILAQMCDYGCLGAEIVDPAELTDAISRSDYVDDELLAKYRALDTGTVLIRGFFVDQNDIAQLNQCLTQMLGAMPTHSTRIGDDSEFVDYHRQVFQPLVFDRVAIIPEWHDVDIDLPVVRLEMSSSFGTGQHETTAMCICLLHSADTTGRALDLGCGSGILGLVALRLGAQHCTMVDIDDQALDAARANLALNGLTAQASVSRDVTGQPFDLICANLTAHILLDLAPQIQSYSRPGTQLILSGILNASAQSVVERFGQIGFELNQSMQRGEWTALALTKL